MKMEKWDLYNAKREKSGITVCRGEIIPKGLYHLSVSVWIVNQQGQYLLSQRHPKKQYPLYWECTGGSVLSGETSLQGAIREVKEELGIRCGCPYYFFNQWVCCIAISTSKKSNSFSYFPCFV